MNLRQLQYFKTIAELEHYTKAAEQLFVSQSNLSHSIKELEEELNVELFVRQGRNVKLTKYGELFLPYVTQALDVLNNGVSAINDRINPDTGSVVIAGFPSLASFIPDVIVRYISETGRMGVHLHFTQSANFSSMKEELMSGKVDLAFGTKIDEPSIAGSYIGEHEPVLLVPANHPLANRQEADLRELDGKPFIAFDHNCEMRVRTDTLFEGLGIRPVITMETAQDVLIYSMVAANQGMSIVPRPIGITPYHIRVLNISNPVPKRELYLEWNKDRYMPPAVSFFRDYVVNNGLIFNQFLERITDQQMSV